MAAAVKAVRNKKRHEREAREEQLEHVPVIFERYDAGSGLAKEELIAALRDVGLVELGPGTDDAIASDLMQRYNYSSSASDLSLEQFWHIVASLQKDPSPASPIQKLFYCQFCRHLPTWRGHERAFVLYTNQWTQAIVAFLIVGNFVVNCVEKEIDPFPAEMQQYLPMWCDATGALQPGVAASLASHPLPRLPLHAGPWFEPVHRKGYVRHRVQRALPPRAHPQHLGMRRAVPKVLVVGLEHLRLLHCHRRRRAHDEHIAA